MTTLYSTQMAKLNASPPSLVKANEIGGRVRSAYFDFTTDGTTSPAVNDVVELVRLPATARIVGGSFSCEAMSTGVGTAQVEIGDSAVSGRLLEVTSVDVAVSDQKFANTILRNFGYETAAETIIQAKVLGEAWATNKKFVGHVLYVTE